MQKRTGGGNTKKHKIIGGGFRNISKKRKIAEALLIRQECPSITRINWLS